MNNRPDNPNQAARRCLTVRGQVQGVGFRPFVYRLAHEIALGGFVRNDGVGVTIEAQGEPAALDLFVRRLRGELPPLARIDRIEERTVAPAAEPDHFRILFSEHGGAAEADVTPDTATCDACRSELFDPSDRRYRYPFINCTHCGPRYSIVRDVPYDRPGTTMSAFVMCRACQGEYDDPSDRRFHAQPNACPICGPRVWLTAPNGKPIDAEDAMADAARALLEGKIVAIRGVGGFHLAVRADRDEPVARLRERKGREHKPLALMVGDLAAAERLVRLCSASRNALLDPQRPIVVAPARPGAGISPLVAPGADTLGVMLPYAPLHHLLLADVQRRHPSSSIHHPASIPLVMTSGNIADEPIAASLDDALAALGEVADLFLTHNREIHRRIDDSVVLAMDPQMQPLRRARGYVPAGIDLPAPGGGHGLAVGGELKNTVAIVRDRGGMPQAVLSEHVGDLKDGRVYRHFARVIEHLVQITHAAPAWIAHDLHPMYLSTTWARRQGLPLIAVQHHHAHVAACLAEHGRTGPVIGLAADGVGFGDDGTLWGGEVLAADLAGYRRLGRVRPIGLPGGDAAAVRTARPAVAWLFDAIGGDVPDRWLERLLPDRTERGVVVQQLVQRFNCPLSSALGRYFDAAAAILGVAMHNRFEAEAPIALEAAVQPGCDDVLPFRLDGGAGVFEIDLRPTVLELVGRTEAGEPAGRLAAAFHNTIAAALSAAAVRAAQRTGLRTVALSGGVFCNRTLMVRLTDLLAAEGFEVLTHRQVPANDGGLALGQAAVGAARAAGLATAVRGGIRAKQ